MYPELRFSATEESKHSQPKQSCLSRTAQAGNSQGRRVARCACADSIREGSEYFEILALPERDREGSDQ